MNQITGKLRVLLLAGIVGIMAGCGGGGGSGSGTTVATTIIAGTASKGIIANGAVKVYAIDAAGAKGATPLQTGTTDANGQFSVDVGVYTGAVIVEVSGVYTDEATNSQVIIDPGSPMRAAIGAVSPASTRRIAVTPLTDLAYNLASASLTPQNIAVANAHVSNIFKISDITAVEPVKPDAASLGAAGTSADQQAYTLALATLSQMAKNSAAAGATPSFSQIAALLDSFKTDLQASASAGLSSANTTGFTAAFVTVASLPGISTLPGLSNVVDVFANVGHVTLKLTLTVESPPAGSGAVGAIQAAVTFPAGASVKVDSSSNQVSSGVFSAIGNAAGSLAEAGFTGSVLTFAVVSPSGFAGGDFGNIIVDIAAGASPVAANFTLSDIKVIDPAGTALNLKVSIK